MLLFSSLIIAPQFAFFVRFLIYYYYLFFFFLTFSVRCTDQIKQRPSLFETLGINSPDIAWFYFI